MKLYAEINQGKLKIVDEKALSALSGRFILTLEKEEKNRTLSQNNAMHKWFELIEQHCQERGLTLDVLFKNPAELPITRHYLKDFFRMVGDRMFGKKSTAKLSKAEIDRVIKTCEMNFAKRLESDIPFPSMRNDIY